MKENHPLLKVILLTLLPTISHAQLTGGGANGGFDCGYNDTAYLEDVDRDGLPDYCRTVGNQPNTYVSCAKGYAGGIFALDTQYQFRLSETVSTGTATCPSKAGKVVATSAATDGRPTFIPPEFVASKIRVDQVMQPKNMLTVASECNNNNSCKAAAKAISAYFELPVDKTITAMAYLAPTREGEGWNSTMSLPSGYVYCSSSMQMISITPHDGPRGSLWRGATDPKGLYLEAWTPTQGFGGGRSWVEAEVTLIGVRQDLASKMIANGKCNSSAAGRTIWYCRGGGCEGGSIRDNGQSVSTSSPPGANSRN